MRSQTLLKLILACLVSLAGTAPARAQMFQDSALQALYLKPDNAAALAEAARKRLAAEPADMQGVLALGLAAMSRNEAEPRRAAIDAAQACLKQQPQAAPCHYALGLVLGAQAISEGMLKAAGSAGRVRDALSQALALAPQWYPARSALQEFYLLAPGLMGGSTAKARELAQGAATPAQVRALQARVELQAGRFPQVLQMLEPLLESADPELAQDAASWGFSAAVQLINKGQAAQAEPFLQQLMRTRPDRASGPFGLARVRAEAGQHEQALALYDQAAAAPDAAMLPVQYRRGIALQELGRKQEARAALQRFIDSRRGHPRSIEDARRRLQELG